jgi:CO dehydrogenase/acetyl-CoA synthase beta subunit
VIERVVENGDNVIDGDSDIDEDDEIYEDEEDEDEEDEEDEEDVEVEAEKAIPLRSAVLQLADLISPKGGSVRAVGVKNVKRRVMRKDGIASKAAAVRVRSGPAPAL